MQHKVLVLGGTRDARLICDALHDKGFDVTLSLAGVTENPEPVRCAVRSGGFGGADGLRDYLAKSAITLLIDATHPFAAQISANATAAVTQTGIAHLRLNRSPWRKQTGAKWISVKTFEEAAEVLPSGARAFLAIGRNEIEPFIKREDISGILRMIEPPSTIIPPNWHLILARPPNLVEPELALMKERHITHLICKNSGGPASLKLTAAVMQNITAVMIARPIKRGGVEFGSVAALLACLRV